MYFFLFFSFLFLSSIFRSERPPDDSYLMNTRAKTRLNNQVLDDSGEKVAKNIPSEMDDLRLREAKIRDDLEHLFHVYDLKDLDTVDEVRDALRAVSDLSQKFRHVHVELKSLLADNYETEFPKAPKDFEVLRSYEKNGRKLIQKLKTDAIDVDAKAVAKSVMSDSKIKARAEMDTLISKMELLNNNVDITLILKTDAVDDYLSKMENLISKFLSVLEKFKVSCGDDWDFESADYVHIPKKFSEDVYMAKLVKQKLDEAKKDAARSDISDKVLIKAQSLYSEILSRFGTLKSKIDVDLKILSDYQILEISQDVKNVDAEFNEVLSKITLLAALVPDGGKAVNGLYNEVCDLRKNVLAEKEKFQADLKKLVLEHDITPEKLKHATDAMPNIPKFSGYDAKLDLFTFKSQYEKHVQPRVLKNSWADYLELSFRFGFQSCRKRTRL